MTGRPVRSRSDGEIAQRILTSILKSGAPKILVWRQDFCTFCNQAYADLDPLMEQGNDGDAMRSLLPHVWPQLRDPLTKALGGAEDLSVQVVLDCGKRRQPPQLCYTAYLSPLYGEGLLPVGVLIDVHNTVEGSPLSEKLLTENRLLDQLFGELPVLMAYGRGEELRLQFVNRAFRRFFDFRPLDSLTLAEAIPEAVEQGFDAILKDVLRSGEPYIANDMPVRFGSGAGETVRFVDFIYQPVRDLQGQAAGILCTGVDVTIRHQMKAVSDSAKHRDLHSSRVNAMGTMAMTLAHELNQPLAAAASYLFAARRILGRSDRLDPETLDALTLGIEQVKRAGKIIQRATPLLKSKGASRVPVAISQAIDNAVCLVSPGRAWDITLTKNIAPNADTVLADEIKLEQVLVNLFRNAAQASQRAARKEIVVSSYASGKNRVRISVRDFGSGFAGADLTQLFELGDRDSRTGLGIGLPLSRTLVEANNGTLSAVAPIGEGAEFILELDAPSAGMEISR